MPMALDKQPATEEWDDDAPPPLNSLPDQLHAAQLANSIIGTAGLMEGELRTAAITDKFGQAQGSSVGQPVAAAKQPFKRGFLDASKSRAKQNCCSKVVNTKQEAMPTLTAKQLQPGAKPIPDFLHVPQSEQDQRLDAVKSQLLASLQPTPDTLAAVSNNEVLMSGFDDPEVMAAVAEVARDPKAFTKYANNTKVLQFYRMMGSFVGNKLEQMEPSR